LKRTMITIVDYGTGNLASITNMLKRIGCASIITSKVDEIARATKLILPGVGAFDTGIRNLANLGLIEILNQKAIVERVPTLGICLGMQLFMDGSQEGNLRGLGWIEGEVVRFNPQISQEKLKIPHMSWNYVSPVKESKLFADLQDDPRFYFVHSYHVGPARAGDVLARTTYGYPFTSAVERDNVAGVQFHPEKSHKFGMKLLQNFAERY